VAPPSYRRYRLPRGRGHLSAAQVAENQRWRLIGAAAEVFAENGIVATTARRISERAGVSNHTFYQHFGNVDDLLATCFDVGADLLTEAVRRSADRGPDATDRVQAALSFAAGEPALATLLGLELAVAIPAVAERRRRFLAGLLEAAGGETPRAGIYRLAAALDRGRGQVAGTAAGYPARLPAELAALLACEADGRGTAAPGG